MHGYCVLGGPWCVNVFAGQGRRNRRSGVCGTAKSLKQCLRQRQKKSPLLEQRAKTKNSMDEKIMHEHHEKVNDEILKALQRIERLARMKVQIMDAINARIDVEREKIAKMEEVRR